MKLTSLLITIICISTINAQTANKISFKEYASEQQKKFTEAYNKKDTAMYNNLMLSFIPKYKALPKDEQKECIGYFINIDYNLACIYSLLNNKILAFKSLRNAIKAGYIDYMHMQVDTDLDNIRGEKEFTEIVEPLRYVSDYMFMLQNASIYNNNDGRLLPAFSYQSKENKNLVTLRKEFNLDSIAGYGNEVSRIINLMHWIHNLIPHDGVNGNPAIKNASSMIAVCKKDKRGLNCRGLAITLNECYLAMGFKSRFVTCLPKDSLQIDQDCHVINAVYSNTYKKWLWIDPTNNAYVMDEKGDLLSVEEVRERIINGKTVIINPDANWNRKSSTLKKDYLYNYMAKNLYILECNVNSEYNVETFTNNKISTAIQLLPLAYFKQTPDKVESINTEKNISFITYKTNNSKAFWQAPE